MGNAGGSAAEKYARVSARRRTGLRRPLIFNPGGFRLDGAGL